MVQLDVRRFVLAILAVCWVVFMSPPIFAQKNKKQDEKRENQRVADAQKQVREHRADINSAEQKLRGLMRVSVELEATLAQARSSLRETRERIADQMAKSMGIDAALTRLKDLREQMTVVSKPILEKLHLTTAWKAAKQAADEAKQSAETVREDIQLTDDQRQAKLDALAKQIVHPNELDRQAILDSREGKRLTDEITAALADIEKIRQAIPDEKVEADPAVVQVHKAIDKADQELKKHAQSVKAQRADVLKAQQRLAQSQQKLQQAQAADARDKNRK